MRTCVSAVAILVLCLCGVSGAVTIYVDAGGGGDYSTISDAAGAASSGDTVLVAAGTYAGPLNRNISLGDKDLVVMSEDGVAVTTIDCEHADRAFLIHGSSSYPVTIAGFTITNGWIEDHGGGVYCAGGPLVTIEDCTFTSNEAAGDGWSFFGGGLYCCDGCNVTLSGCTFLGNRADAGGGACLLGASGAISDCYFSGNEVPQSGGGLASAQSVLTMESCEFVGNDGGNGGGGAVLNDGSSTVIDVTFRDNIAYWGGGVYDVDPSSEFTDCRFIGNTGGNGGGFTGWLTSPVLTSCVFSGNAAPHGAAVYSFSGANVQMENCTLYANESNQYGGAIGGDDSSFVLLEHSIVAFSVGGPGVSCFDLNEASVVECVVFGNDQGDVLYCGDSVMLVSDPLFCDATGGDLSLCSDSPCLPDGNPWGVLVGAIGQGCGPCSVPVERSSWGQVKALFR